ACWKFEDLETAAETFGRVLTLQPHNGDAIVALIAIAIERKDHKRALDLHRRLTSLGQHAPELAYNLGLLLQASGENDSATECYLAAVEHKPEFPEALLNLGHALRATGKEQEARAAWGK